MDKDQAKIELERLLAEGEADIGAGRTYTLEEVRAHVAELLAPKNTIYLTGDTHGQFKRVIEFCQRQDVQPESTLPENTLMNNAHFLRVVLLRCDYTPSHPLCRV